MLFRALPAKKGRDQAFHYIFFFVPQKKDAIAILSAKKYKYHCQ